MLSDASRNMPAGMSSQSGLPLDEAELTRRSQRAIWCVLALIGTMEVMFGAWLVGMIGPR
jgi:hypothetical protein